MPNEPSARASALAQGLHHYATGKPCKHGHVSDRYTVNGTCIACDLEKSKRYVAANASEVKARKERYYQANAEHVKAKSLAAYAADPERAINRVHAYRVLNVETLKAKSAQRYARNKPLIRAQAAQHYLANRDAVCAANAAWKRQNPHKLAAYNAARRAVSRLATPPWADRDAIDSVYATARLAGGHVDHIVPLISPKVCGLHVACNLQVLPASENLRKSNTYWPGMP